LKATTKEAGVNRKTIQLKLKGAGVLLAVALLVPAAARGASTDAGVSRPAVQIPASVGARIAVAVPSSSVERQAGATTRQGGLGWQEAAIGGGILLGILLFGLWGDVVVGGVIFGAAVLLGLAATLATRTLRRAAPRKERRWEGVGAEVPQ
jgi:hypothetical protein